MSSYAIQMVLGIEPTGTLAIHEWVRGVANAVDNWKTDNNEGGNPTWLDGCCPTDAFIGEVEASKVRYVAFSQMKILQGGLIDQSIALCTIVCSNCGCTHHLAWDNKLPLWAHRLALILPYWQKEWSSFLSQLGSRMINIWPYGKKNYMVKGRWDSTDLCGSYF